LIFHYPGKTAVWQQPCAEYTPEGNMKGGGELEMKAI